jgi:hypothetical protein
LAMVDVPLDAVTRAMCVAMMRARD